MTFTKRQLAALVTALAVLAGGIPAASQRWTGPATPDERTWRVILRIVRQICVNTAQSAPERAGCVAESE